MKMNDTIDFLTYQSWWYQINWYGMDKVRARKLFSDWKQFEEKFEQEKIRGNGQVSPNQEGEKCFSQERINKIRKNHKRS